jgi:hypothetical protein
MEINYKKEQPPRITIYCKDERMQRNIRHGLEILKNKFNCKTNDEVLNKIIQDRLYERN